LEVGSILSEMRMSRNDILVLNFLLENNCTSEIKAVSIKKISEKTGISYYSVRNIIKALTYAGLCGIGLKNGSSFTYYIGEGGKVILKRMKEGVLAVSKTF
jgi:predicted transcriptional regulator